MQDRVFLQSDRNQSRRSELAKIELPRVHSRDELASLEISQLRAKIGDVELQANNVRARGLEPIEGEVECCYLRRELETRLLTQRGT